MKSGIYQIRNIKNNHRYIGASEHIQARWHQHRALLKAGNHYNKRLQTAWNRHGAEAFTFEVLEYTENIWAREASYLTQLPEYNQIFSNGAKPDHLPTKQQAKEPDPHIEAISKNRKENLYFRSWLNAKEAGFERIFIEHAKKHNTLYKGYYWTL